jgi:lysophospholipase L1-like esterase
MLKTHNIKVIFVKTTRISVPDFFTFNEYKTAFYYDSSNKDITNNQSSKDSGHFSHKGHKLIAENLYKHIINLKLNEQ